MSDTTTLSTRQPESRSSPSSRRVGLEAGRPSGLITALPTPFDGDRPDLEAFADLVRRQIAGGASGLAVGGPTGEGPTLTLAELVDLVRTAVGVSAGRTPVLAGICVSSTRTAIETACAAASSGADALLVSTPAYNKPLQEGIYRHVEAIARAVGIPVIVLNDPGRTRIDLTFETVRRLAEIGNVTALVDETGDLDRPAVTSLVTGGRLGQLAGSDAAAVRFNMAGGQGCLSVVANVAPRLCATLQACCRTGDWAGAMAIHHRLRPLVAALQREGDPAPIKFALSLALPRFSPRLRLPLTDVSRPTAEAISAALSELEAGAERDVHTTALGEARPRAMAPS